MSKPSIPSITNVAPDVMSVLKPVKENIEILTGRRGVKITELKDNASTSDIIKKINLIVKRLED